MSLAPFTAEIRSGKSLGREGAKEALRLILDPASVDDDIRSLLLALNERPPRAEELAGFAEGMLERARPIPGARGVRLADTCGTGGDGLQTFNLSTAAALVAAGAGLSVAKHGNRSVSSRSGSADVLEAAGVRVGEGPGEAAASIAETGFAFLFAPVYHPSMKRVAPVRKAMGVRTIFNLLGPLVNPARPVWQMTGVYDPALLELYARTLVSLGVERALVVRGEDGMDELSPCGPTRVVWAEAGRPLRAETVTPESAGLERVLPGDLRGGDAAHNARLLGEVLSGEPGPLLEGTLLNAGGVLLAAGKAAELRDCVALARESVASGRAASVLEKLRERSR